MDNFLVGTQKSMQRQFASKFWGSKHYAVDSLFCTPFSKSPWDFLKWTFIKCPKRNFPPTFLVQKFDEASIGTAYFVKNDKLSICLKAYMLPTTFIIHRWITKSR
jgi:hypothetical protein